MKNKKRTNVLIVRLTAEELATLKTKCREYSSISHYVRTAISEYNDSSASTRIAKTNELIELYDQYHNLLYHTSANLNQITKRANELSIAGKLSESFLNIELLPKVAAAMDAVIQLRTELKEVTKKVAIYK